MKAAITDGRGQVRLMDVRTPEPGAYQCLCRILACATCSGTDQKIITSALPFVSSYPAVLGHESVGRVVALGAKVRYIQKGDLFLRPTAVYGGERLDEYHSGWGGFAEYGLVTDTRALLEDTPDARPHHYCRFQQQIPASTPMSAADATLLVTLKEVASVVASLRLTFASRVLILGSGPVALAMCRFAKILGAYPVIVVGRRDEPLARARALGADFTVNTQREEACRRVLDVTDGRGADYAIETSGDEELLKQTLGMLAPNGKIVAYATYRTKESAGQHIPADRLQPTGINEPAAHQYLLDALRLGLVNPSDFYSHRLPFERIESGFALLKARTASKVVFEMEACS